VVKSRESTNRFIYIRNYHYYKKSPLIPVVATRTTNLVPGFSPGCYNRDQTVRDVE